MASLNLLPWRQRRREQRRRRFLAGLAAAFLGAVTVVVGIGWLLGGLIGDQQRHNRQLAASIVELDARIVEIDKLRRDREHIQDRMRVLEQLRDQRATTVGILAELTRTMVPGAHYTALIRRGGVITARGVAESNDRVSKLMRGLGDSPWFTAPSLQRIEKAPAGPATDAYGDQAADFELTLLVTPPAAVEG